MKPSLCAKLPFWKGAVIATGLLVIGYLLISLYHRSVHRLSGLLGFDLPPGIERSSYKGDFPFGDTSQAWLMRFPPGTSRPWESSAEFRECSPHPDPAEDYLYIRSIIHAEFPHAVALFQRPRIWRGGHEGNCYVASSDDGTDVFFYYFTT